MKERTIELGLQAEVPGLATTTGADGAGCRVMARDEAVPLPQALEPVTVMFPDDAPAPNETTILFVPDPAVILAPVGNVQLYVDAFAMDATEYVTPVDDGQGVLVPEIVPAADGKGDTVTGKAVEAVPVLQGFDGTTVTVPEEAAEDTDTVTELVPDPAVMVYPVGKLHA